MKRKTTKLITALTTASAVMAIVASPAAATPDWFERAVNRAGVDTNTLQATHDATPDWFERAVNRAGVDTNTLQATHDATPDWFERAVQRAVEAPVL